MKHNQCNALMIVFIVLVNVFYCLCRVKFVELKFVEFEYEDEFDEYDDLNFIKQELYI